VANRVVAAQVKEIIETSKSDTLLDTQFIVTANLYINEHLLDVGHSEEMLGKIELYLAAHFVAVSDSRGALIVDAYGDAREEYSEGVYGQGLLMTSFGQQAISLDTSGVLAGLAEPKKRALFRVV
jgi:hypothetical protein